MVSRLHLSRVKSAHPPLQPTGPVSARAKLAIAYGRKILNVKTLSQGARRAMKNCAWIPLRKVFSFQIFPGTAISDKGALRLYMGQGFEENGATTKQNLFCGRSQAGRVF